MEQDVENHVEDAYINNYWLWILIFTVFFSCRIDITFGEPMSGVACDLNSRGYKVLHNATKEVIGHVKPYSLTGSLPVIRELQVKHCFVIIFFSGVYCTRFGFSFFCYFYLQEDGFDVQTAGYGMIYDFFPMYSFLTPRRGIINHS